MDSRVVPVRGLTAGDEDAWRDLAVRAAEPNPFYEPDSVVPAARHQPGGGAIMLAVAESGGRWYGCLPFRLVHRWKFPYPIATSQVRRMGYPGTPLVDANAGVEAAAALLSAVASKRTVRDARILIVDSSWGNGAVAGLLRSAAAMTGFPMLLVESCQRGFLARRAVPDYLSVLSGKSRYNLRRSRHGLEAVLGGAVRVVDRTSDREAIDEYIALEASGYKARTGIAMATRQGEPEYFAELCARFRKAGRLYVLALQGPRQEVLAMQVWIKAGVGIFMMKISYDERYARYSPGIILQVEALSCFHESGAEWIDTCTHPGNDTLLRLYPQRQYVEVLAVVLSRNLVDLAVIKAFVGMRPLHHRLYIHRHPASSSKRK